MDILAHSLSSIEYGFSDFDYTKHVEFIHGANNEKCYVTLFKKGIKGNYHRHFNYSKSLVEKIEDFFNVNNHTDLYMSLNTFYKPQRTLETLRYINTLHIDLDTYKTKFTKTQILMRLEEEYFNISIPRPNLIIDSGRGLNLIWAIEPVPSKALPLWKALMYKFFNELKEFGADNSALDPTRVLRVIGSINSKTNTEVKLLDGYSYKYSLKELKEEYLPEVNKKVKKERKVINFFSPSSLERARIEDLERLCKLRNYDLEGYREYLLFYYRYLLCRNFDDEYALEKVLELNSKFTEPLPIREVINNTKSGERYSSQGKYHYSSNRLIDIFNITPEEQLKLNVIQGKAIKYQKNNDRRKAQRRNKNGLTQREQLKLDKLKLIFKLKEDNCSNNEIAETLNLSLRQVQRYIKELENTTIPEIVEMKLSHKEIVDEIEKEQSPKEIVLNNNSLFSSKNVEEQALFTVSENNKSLRDNIIYLSFRGS
jgi:predicted transcriptional regulator